MPRTLRQKNKPQAWHCLVKYPVSRCVTVRKVEHQVEFNLSNLQCIKPFGRSVQCATRQRPLGVYFRKAFAGISDHPRNPRIPKLPSVRSKVSIIARIYLFINMESNGCCGQGLLLSDPHQTWGPYLLGHYRWACSYEPYLYNPYHLTPAMITSSGNSL